MKRLLISVCAVVAIVAMVTPALALDFGSATLGGYFRTRAWWHSDADLNDDADPNNTTYIDGRLRIEPTWKINDNVVLKQRWELDYGNFEGPIIDANTGNGDFDRQELDILRAWAEIKLPFGKFKFGRMPISWGVMINDNGSEQDGFRLDMDFGPLSVFPFYFKLLENNRALLDDVDEYGIGLLYNAEWMEVGSVFKYHSGYTSTAGYRYFGGQDNGRPAQNQEEFQWLPYAKVAFGPFVASSEWMFRFGTAWRDAADDKIKNKAFRNAKGILKLEYNMKPFSLLAEGGWAKGERYYQSADENYTYGNPWHADYDVDVVLWEKIEGQVQNAGYLRLEGTWQATKKLKVVVGAIHSWRDQRARDVDSSLGFEIDTWIKYSVLDNFEINFTGGYFFPGGYYEDMKEQGLAAPGGVTGDDASFLLKTEFRVFF